MSLNIGILSSAYKASGGALLLDTYPGAAVAFSLRKLRTAYTGSCIRVRRSSDNTETDIGFVAGVLDTASLLTFVGAGNGFIKTWYDQSTNSNNAVQNTAALQIRIVTSGVLVTKNSKPSARIFTNEHLILNSLITGIAGTLINLSATATDPPINENAAPIGLLCSSPDASYQPLNNGIIFENFASTTRKVVGNPTTNTSNLYIYNVISDVNLYNVKINNATFFNTTTNIVGFGLNFPQIGRSYSNTFGFYNFVGFISEIIVYNSNQNTNISNINTNINSFYTIY